MAVDGPGAYEPECSAARLATESELTLLIVMKGNRGDGFSLATTDPRWVDMVPEVLRNVAGEIDEQLKRARNGGN